jgi:hypothetical protein
VSEVLPIPVFALPYLALSSAAIALLVAWLTRPKTPPWHAYVRFAVAVAAWSLLNVLWLCQTSSSAAAAWLRWIPALSLLAGTAAIESLAQVWSIRLPRFYRTLYVLGLVFLGFSALWHPLLVGVGRVWVPGSADSMALAAAPRVLVLAGAAALGLAAGLNRRRQLVYLAAVGLFAMLNLASFLWLPYHHVYFPADWLAAGVLLIFLAARPPGAPDSRNVDRAAKVLDALEGYHYGAAVLASAAAGVLCVGLRDLGDLKDGDAAAVVDALGKELAGICRAGDRVVRLDQREFLIVLPAIAFQDEARVRERVEQSIRSVVVYLGDHKIPIDRRVHVGWAWGDRAVSFNQVVQQARRSLYEETWRSARVAFESGGR